MSFQTITQLRKRFMSLIIKTHYTHEKITKPWRVSKVSKRFGWKKRSKDSLTPIFSKVSLLIKPKLLDLLIWISLVDLKTKKSVFKGDLHTNQSYGYQEVWPWTRIMCSNLFQIKILDICYQSWYLVLKDGLFFWWWS